jgi:hypothetical protein
VKEGGRRGNKPSHPIHSPLWIVVPLWTRPIAAEEAMRVKAVGKETQTGTSIVELYPAGEGESNTTGRLGKQLPFPLRSGSEVN